MKASPYFQTATGIATLLLSTGILAYYFLSYEHGRRSALEPWRTFYKPLDADWFRTSEAEMRAAITAGDLDPFELLCMRTALGRWRIRHIVPGAFEELMRDYDRGLWLGHNSDDWRRTLDWLDSQWKEARRTKLQRDATVPSARVAREGTDGLIIAFPPNTMAYQLGSFLRLQADVPADAVPTDAPQVYWETTTASGTNPYHCRLATIESDTSATTAGLRRVTLGLDMSWEPLWIAPAVQPRALHLRSPGASTWKNLSLDFSDSDLLPVR